MTDAFATLGLPRSAWHDEEEIKIRFHALGAKQHPDAGGNTADFSALNTAWQTLRDPAQRLRHFLELEHPDSLALAQRTPAELGDLFMDVAAARQSAQSLAGKLASASALSKALLEPERIATRTKLESLQAGISARLDQSHTLLRTGTPPPETLATTLATLTFLGKWAAQVRESLLALS